MWNNSATFAFSAASAPAEWERFTTAHHWYAWYLAFVGRHDASIAEMKRAAELDRTTEARAILAQLQKESAETYVPAYNIALVYLRLGDKDRVFEWLEKSAAQHERELMTVNVEPRFDALRSDPRFQALIRKINFPG